MVVASPLYIFQSQKPPLLSFPFSFSELPPSPTPASLIQLPSLREGKKGSSGGPKGEEAVGGPLSHLESFPPLHLLLCCFPLLHSLHLLSRLVPNKGCNTCWLY